MLWKISVQRVKAQIIRKTKNWNDFGTNDGEKKGGSFDLNT